MDLRRTTIRSAALAALLIALPLAATAEPAPADDGPAPPPPLLAAAPAPAPVMREFFWMNALRSDHDAHARATAGSRMRTDVDHLRRGRVDFGVLAETAPDQRHDFRRLGGDTWALVTGGNTIDNVVFYRRSALALVDREALTIRYVGGQRVRLAIPVLQDRATGNRVAVIPVHNPRQKVGPWRRISLAREVAKVRQLRRRHPAWEVVIAGDFNAEWTPACAFTHLGLDSLVATRHTCHRRLPIDQMYATPGLRPHDYRGVPTSATDHHREYHATLVL
jgi:hypothetical protein